MANQIVVPEDVVFDYLLDELRTLSWSCADILMSYARGETPPFGFPQALNIEEGGDGPVSAADMAVNEFLINGIKEKFPKIDWGIVSEETAKGKMYESRQIKKDWQWILDPLDGTKDFLQGSENYAVHLALVYKNEPRLGIVLIPERNELCIGIMGNGAWFENRDGEKKSISFSNRKEISELILVSSKNHQQLILQKLLQKMNFGDTKKIGSVGCKVASILRGDADVYISMSGRTSPKDWDMAAPQAIIEAAGGAFTHADGKCLEYLRPGYSQTGCLIASHGKSHQKICKNVIRFLSEVDKELVV